MTQFEVIMRARNAEKYIGKAIRSVMGQSYGNWHCTIALDDPEDHTFNVVLNTIGDDRRFAIKWQEHRVGLTKNMLDAIEYARVDSDTVLAILDGDDWLRHDALSIVANKYDKHPDTLLTYGSYIKESKGAKTKTSRPYAPTNHVRNVRWHGSHLKTFKANLWRQIPLDYLKHDGDWFPVASDVAMMIPMIEMAGLERCRHVFEAIYYYRDRTPYTCNRDLQRKCETIIRAKKPLKRIPEL